MKTKPKIKKLKLTTEKKKAWKVFSEYIRRKYSIDGIVECYTCGYKAEWKKMQAGHGIGGRNNSILFNEDLVKPQCSLCNLWKRGNYARFTRRLIDELGLEQYDSLIDLSNQTLKVTALGFQVIRERYMKKLEELK